MSRREDLLHLRAVVEAVRRGDAAMLGAEVFRLRGVISQLLGMVEGHADRYPELETSARKARAITRERPDVRARAG
jgi:hypothetical protein